MEIRNLRESFEDDQREIDEIALNNGFLDDMVDSLQISNTIEKTDNGWVYLRSDYGGRDFFDEIPIQYIDEDEMREIEDYCILDSGIEDYDWGGYSGDIDYVQELLFDHFADLLIDHLDDVDALKEDKTIDSEVAYTIGYLDDGDIGYIGWNSETDYYDVVFVDGLTEKEDWCFTETNDIGEEVYVYRCDTVKEAEDERLYAQIEFTEDVIVIKVVKRGNFWYPIDEKKA